MKEGLKEALRAALESVGLSATDIPIEHPSELKNGDYSSPVALVEYRKFASAVDGHVNETIWTKAKSPKALAELIVKNLKVDGIAKIEIAGAGFINFYLTSAALAESLEKARAEDMWGANANLAGKKIMVEYTDPNPFKEFHIGHLMSNAIGESISRLFQFSGAEVKRANYQGDVGPHVAKAIWGYMNIGGQFADDISRWSAAYVQGAKFYETDERIKADIERINQQIYDHSEEQINTLYNSGRNASLAHFEELYKILGTKFDYSFFEHATAPKGVEIVRAHPEVFEQSDGAVVYKGEKIGLHTRVFITSKGLPTYETKELGLAELKTETWGFDTSITVTAHEQAGYFSVVLAAMKEVMPAIAAKVQHVSHGMMRFAEGKMSSRTGNVITGESLLTNLTDAAKVRAAESRLPMQAGADNVEDLAQAVAVAAIKYQILKQASGKDIIFDRERALSLEGDSGPYIQYAHARAQQIVEKAKEQNVAAKVDANTTPDNLTRLLHRFPEIVEYATSLREPHLLTSYLLEIAGAFNSWYAQIHILDGSTGSPHKVALADAVRRTLKNGLWILGIPAPDKM